MKRAGRYGTKAVLGLILLAGCDFGIRLSGSPPVANVPASTAKPVASQSSVPPADPLGEKPILAAAKDFTPPSVTAFQGPGGITVWHLERPELPVVSASFVIPYGSASDPKGKPGTMSLLADMLDEGAGKRSALEVSETLASLGASFGVAPTLDGTTASLTSLRTKFDTSFEILCDIVARPKLGKEDFTRVKKLWKNNLKKRSDDPMAVAATVMARTMYGADSPYGHPSAGLFSKADAVELSDLKSAYEKAWRPDRLTLVVVGQITRPELEAALSKNLQSWTPKGEPLPAPAPSALLSSRPQTIVVHRAGAVQTVVMVSGPGVAASSSEGAPLSLINDAVGGSFTSRLNLKLREELNWTYGVGSGFTLARSQGLFSVRTSLEAPYTAPGFAEIVKTLDDVATNGLTSDELLKVKAQDKRDLIETFEGSTSTNARLAQLASLGLPAGYDASATKLRQAADASSLQELAKTFFDSSKMTVVMVGDRETIKASFDKEKRVFEPVELNNEGELPGATKPEPAAPAKPK